MTTERATQPKSEISLQRPLADKGPLLPVSDTPPSPAEIAFRIEPQIADHLEQAAWWPDHELREGWKLGDYSLYAIGFPAAGFKSLYVRFISEPHREAMLEICSGTEDPNLKDAASSSLKESLRGLGFHPGVGCAGFQKPVRVESPDDCRLLAKEVAGLVTGCLGYDPGGPIVFNKSFGERAGHARVFHSIRMGDIERLLRSSGFVLWQIDGRSDIGFRTVDRPRFEVRPYVEVPPGSGSYRAFQFAFYVKVEPEIAEAIARDIATAQGLASVSATNGSLTITHRVLIQGGLTEANLRFHLYLWRRLLDRVVESYYRHSDDDDG